MPAQDVPGQCGQSPLGASVSLCRRGNWDSGAGARVLAGRGCRADGVAMGRAPVLGPPPPRGLTVGSVPADTERASLWATPGPAAGDLALSAGAWRTCPDVPTLRPFKEKNIVGKIEYGIYVKLQKNPSGNLQPETAPVSGSRVDRPRASGLISSRRPPAPPVRTPRHTCPGPRRGRGSPRQDRFPAAARCGHSGRSPARRPRGHPLSSSYPCLPFR